MQPDPSPVAWLRGAALLSWTDTGQVGSGAFVDDLGGGGTLVWTWGSAVPCRVDALSGQEQMAGERISDRSTHVVMAPADVVVSPANQFLVAGRGTFEVTAVEDRTGQTVLEFEVVKVN